MIGVRPHSRVLCFSRDPQLLKTRGMVLATSYEPVMIGSLAELQALAGGPAFDVVVLCHTLSPQECQRSTSIVRRQWPRAKILALSADHESCREQVDEVVECMAGPRLLLKTIDRLLQRGNGFAGRI